MPEPITFETTASAVFSVDAETRTIRGLVVPFNVIGDNGRGKFMFTKATKFSWPSDVKRVKLLLAHDPKRAVGHALSLDLTPKGIVGAFKVARGAEGDHALSMAEDGVWDGLSAGVGRDAEWDEKDGMFHGRVIPLAETSLTPIPAFDDARVISVAASAALNKEDTMPEGNSNGTAPEGTATPAAGATDFSAVTDAITAGFAAVTVPARETVPAGEGVTRSELPYRFDGTKGAYGFLADIKAQKFAASSEAAQRLEKFLGEAFASITTGNVAGHNPVPTRPELFVDNLHFGRPLWNLVTQGTLDDITAFIIPKFASSSGLVGTHAAGVEPTEGAYTATTQTVTPTAMSGKAILNREVVDQGGNPKVDAIIWNEMVSGYYDDMEEAIQTVLNAVATGEQNFGAGADAKAKVMLLKAFLASLQFVKGGDRFSAFAADPTAYDTLTSAVDTTGRPLLPVLGATNADGTLAPSLESVSIGGKRAVPCWALNETVANAEESYLFVPTSVYAWQSAPHRIDIENKVATVEVGIWGYKATAVTRDSDVIPLDFTTADV